MSDLILDSLELYNFKGLLGGHRLKLDRNAGLYHIAGQNKINPELGANGVGKTTIWDGLLWVLWGKTGRDSRPGAAITPWSGGNHSWGKVRVRRGSNKFAIHRERNPNHLQLMTDGSSVREITQDEIPKLLGLSEELFRRAMVWGQFGTMFLDLRPDEQAKMFTEALSLDVWLRAALLADAECKAATKTVLELDSGQRAIRSIIESFAEQIEENANQAKAFDDRQIEEAETVKGEIESLKAEVRKIKAGLERLPRPPEPSPRSTEILDEIDDAPAQLQKDKQKASRLAGIGKRCPKCKQLIIDDSLQKELMALDLAYNKKLKALHEELRAVSKTFTDANHAYSQLTNNYTKAKSTLEQLESRIGFLRQKLAGIDKQWNPYREIGRKLKDRRAHKRAELVQLEADMKRATAEQEVGAFWTKAFKDIRLSIIDEVLLELEVAACRHAGLLGLSDWGVRFETERETKSGTVSYGFTTLLYPPDEEKPVKWESYSGGESQRLQLAVSFALAEVLLARAGVEPNIEVLDEPTRGLSPEGISDLLEHLRERALELDRSIYLVDHHALDRGAFDGTLLVTKDTKGSRFGWV